MALVLLWQLGSSEFRVCPWLAGKVNNNNKKKHFYNVKRKEPLTGGPWQLWVPWKAPIATARGNAVLSADGLCNGEEKSRSNRSWPSTDSAHCRTARGSASPGGNPGSRTAPLCGR